MVNAGDTVTWVWDNADYHSVSSTRRPAWDSGFTTAARRSRRSPGRSPPRHFPYQCNVHGPSMHGTITVM